MNFPDDQEPRKPVDMPRRGWGYRFFWYVAEWFAEQYVPPSEAVVTKPQPVEPFKELG